MAFEDILGYVIIALVAGFLLGWLFVKAQITAIEQRYKADLERWKAESAAEIRKDSVNRSRSTLKGKIAEQMAPLLPSFGHLPADARFIGSPVDYIIFDGLTSVVDEKGSSIRIVFMDVKHGSATLSRTQRVIKKAVEEKAVEWQTLHLDDDQKDVSGEGSVQIRGLRKADVHQKKTISFSIGSDRQHNPLPRGAHMAQMGFLCFSKRNPLRKTHR